MEPQILLARTDPDNEVFFYGVQPHISLIFFVVVVSVKLTHPGGGHRLAQGKSCSIETAVIGR